MQVIRFVKNYMAVFPARLTNSVHLFFVHPVHSEGLFRDMADRLAEDGWRELGYEYIIIDDCWMSRLRDEQGRLQPEPSRLVSFPPPCRFIMSVFCQHSPLCSYWSSHHGSRDFLNHLCWWPPEVKLYFQKSQKVDWVCDDSCTFMERCVKLYGKHCKPSGSMSVEAYPDMYLIQQNQKLFFFFLHEHGACVVHYFSIFFCS